MSGDRTYPSCVYQHSQASGAPPIIGDEYMSTEAASQSADRTSKDRLQSQSGNSKAVCWSKYSRCLQSTLYAIPCKIQLLQHSSRQPPQSMPANTHTISARAQRACDSHKNLYQDYCCKPALNPGRGNHTQQIASLCCTNCAG